MELSLFLVSREGMTYEVEGVGTVAWDAQKEKWMIKIAWRGFSDVESSWERLDLMLDQVPEMVLEHLTHWGSTDKRAFAKCMAEVRAMVESVVSRRKLTWECPQ